MYGQRRHLSVVPPPDDVPVHPTTVKLPEYIAYFMAQLPRDFTSWLLDSPEDVPTQIRRMGGDLYLTGLSHEESEATAERFMLCVEMAQQFGLHHRGSFDDEARLTFALISMTVAERAWMESSPTQQASHMRALQRRIATSKLPDDNVMGQYAEAVETARRLQMMDLGLNFRYAISRSR